MIERLNQSFSLSNTLVFIKDRQNFVRASLTSGAKHRADVLLHGAQVVSWMGPMGEELLFCSSRAVFERGKPVRGGIPVIFPQFGKGELPSHGFARTSMWEVKETKLIEEGVPSITLKLGDNNFTREMWSHQFMLELTITLSDRLKMDLRVINCGTVPFFFFTGFHTYFKIADITRTKVLGLKDITFMDCLRGRKFGVQNLEAFDIEEHTDRAYLNAPDTVSIRDELMNREYIIRKSNMKDCVVWNPWEDGSRAFGDLGSQEYLSFLCVEPVVLNQKVTLNPREKFECGQELAFR